MVFGRRGRQRVVEDLQKVWQAYKDIVTKQHHLRSDLEKIYHLEQREVELMKQIQHFQSIKDIDDAKHMLQNLIKEELHFVYLMEKHSDRSMSHLKGQRKLLNQIKRDLKRLQ